MTAPPPYALLALTIAAAGCAGPPASGGGPGPPAGGVILAEGRPAGAGAYAGASACRRCHDDIYRLWNGTGHARSLESLVHSRDQANPSCLRCHATGFGERTGYDAPEGGPPGLGSVGCEGCHGPSRDHASSDAPGVVVPNAGSDCPPCEIHKTCRACHTLTRSPGFELTRGLEAVSCRSLLVRGAEGP